MNKIILSLILSFYFLSACSPEKPTLHIHTQDAVHDVTVEIADNDEERARGLMWRDSVPENTGMLFIYPEDIDAVFWMKNMKVPIDMIFITSQKTVDTIHHSVPPCLADQTCARYSSEGLVRYILEVRAGYAKENNIQIGDNISFEHFLP